MKKTKKVKVRCLFYLRRKKDRNKKDDEKQEQKGQTSGEVLDKVEE